MIPSHNPVDSFFNSVRLIECSIRRAAKDLESQCRTLRHHSFHGNGKYLHFIRNPIDFAPSSAEEVQKCGLLDGGKVKPSFLWFPIVAKSVERKNKQDSFSGSLHFVTAWSILFGSIESFKKCFQKQCLSKKDRSPRFIINIGRNDKNKMLSCELLLCYAIHGFFQSLHMFLLNGNSSNDPFSNQFDHMKLIVEDIIEGRKSDVNDFLSSLGFARVGGSPPNLTDMDGSVNDDANDPHLDGNRGKEEPDVSSSQKLATGLLNIPLSNVERLRSTLSTVSLPELVDHLPYLVWSSNEHPDKKKLFSVQDFFRYTEVEGKRFFDELDRDGDGQVTLDDLEVAMRKRKLPKKYARDFFHRTRSHMFSKSFGWKRFLSLIKQKDPTILRAYTTLCLSKSGMLQKNHILTSLKSAGLPANEDNAASMLRCLVADSGGSISYSHFRNFMLLLPSERLEEDPRSIWFEAATVVAVPPPVEIPAGSVLKSALAGGLASALSTSLLYPVDTMKTRVQASSLSFPELLAKLPQIGIRGLYRGSIPAIIGQFSSHGLRTGIFEASKLVLVNVAPTLVDIQVQSLSSFCSTILGTAVRIPCEVMKQRLQAGLFENVGEAFVGTIRQDGFKGFFRGIGATLCREVPFYVAGMSLYAEAKKGAQTLLKRELKPYEIIIVGAVSGGLAAVVTTPFDVMKTRMMTAQGRPVSMSMVAFSILRKEGPLGLFKGAVPRFFWIAPLGAMNFAGYELAKKAMDEPESEAVEQ